MKRALVALAALAALACNAFPAAAGTTGSVNGVVSTSSGAPLAGARVVVVSPSQTAATTTDASGHFALLSLAPDTYTVTASKSGYETSTITGISVFADQVQRIGLTLAPSLHTIAHVTSRSSMDVVKPGTTSDIYSVNSTVTQAAAGLGGGGNLNNAYSAIATVPGAFVPQNQQGWDQVVYIRGGSYDQVGYEFDGVPVNRSFDNYPGGTAGTLGQQELQVYAGGGTSGEAASGLAGFINQVIKTGTYPGYANVNGGIGSPSYYHSLQLEVGGATPDRLFSYYAGIGGYNQDFRYFDQFNGSNLGDVWGVASIADNTINDFNLPGDYPTCGYTPPANLGFYTGPNRSAIYDPMRLAPGQPGYVALPPGVSSYPGCYNTISPAYASYSNLSDRESVFNFHIGIPHRHDGGRDDVQLLYDNDSLLSQYYSSQNDIGPNVVQQLNEWNVYRDCVVYATSSYPCVPSAKAQIAAAPPLIYGDFITWAPGTYFGEPAADAKLAPYFEPGTPGDRCANIASTTGYGSNAPIPGACPAGTYSTVPGDVRDGFWNNASIVKIQYQHNMGSNAYLRFYGYTFYSDWLQTSPLSYGSGLYGFGVTSYDYELESHTRGLALQFADQMNSQNLLTFNANYTAATTNRYNNTTFNNGNGTTYLSAAATNLVAGNHCIAYASGSYLGESYKAGQPAPCNSPLTQGTFLNPQPGPALGGGTWDVTYTGNSGFVNTIAPNFYGLSLEDQWNPTDRLNVDLGLRDQIYIFNLANTSDDGQNFWFLAGQNEFCYNPVTLAPYVIPANPRTGFPATPFVGFNCPMDDSNAAHPVQTVHPNGKDGNLLLSNVYSPTLTDTAFTPRIGLTYTLNNNTVLRASAGRYVQEPETYQVQYDAKDNNLAYDLFQAFWQYGYTTPRHDPLVQYSNNYDASWEQRLKGTDMSFKFTPYYRYATNQIYNIALPFGLTGGLNTGIERVDGVEFEFTKGDFSKDGLSFLLSYTYTNAAESYADYPGTSINPIDPYNQNIENFNALTKAGGGAACYSFHANGLPMSCSNPKAIANPYYAMRPQPLLDRNGWYPVGLDYGYLSPNTVTAIANYRHSRFAVTPSVQFNEGQPYGNPGDVEGIDPRTCTNNSRRMTGSPIHTANPLQADYTSCLASLTQTGTYPGELFIPNPQTGVFDSFGTFRQPNQLNLSLAMSYDINQRVTANLILTNLLNACFGGSNEPWSRQFAPNSYTCGYQNNYFYVSNFYNGVSPNDKGANGVALNPAFANAYVPAWADTNAYTLPGPFNAYLQFQIKI
ncbi:MAG TPA: TonB-dependent receptor [Candidatus Acidoferrales bacterium]|nr:TonB-dependent receptor [Candidatus Acidoferrales bacterium]